MANEVIKSYLTEVTVNTEADTLADATFDGGTGTVVALTSANHSDYPLADLVLAATWATSTDIHLGFVNVYRRDINQAGGTGDDPLPALGYKKKFVGSFVPDAVTSAQTMTLLGVPLSSDQEFYIENQTGQTISTGWTLKAVPWTYGTA